eukprot:877134-Alexandrium_andersonii.AAC.1
MGGGGPLPEASIITSITPSGWEELLTEARLRTDAPREGEEGGPTESPLNAFQKARFRRFRQACRIVAGLDWADPEPPSATPG